MASKAAWFALMVLKTLCAAVIFFSFVFTVYAVGPELETRFLPVTSKVEILSMEATPDGQTKVKAAFRKYRDCEYVGISWFSGKKPDDFERVAVQLMREPGDTSSPNRPVGYQRAGPWIIGVPIDEFKHGSFAQLVHRCHPFWNSITDFYP